MVSRMNILKHLRRLAADPAGAPPLVGAAVAALCAASTPVHAAEPLTLYYNERPPYLVTGAQPDKVVGLTADPAARAVEGAGFVPLWSPLPSTRQLVTLREGHVPACAVGWFKNPERELSFKFTKPIYRDKPTVAIARSDFDAHSSKLAEVFQQPGLRVLVKDKYSYGPWIDSLLARSRSLTVSTTEENVQMVRMIAGKRADIMFSSQEEAQYLLTQSSVAASAVKVLRFDDVPHGEKRYIMCSRSVPDETLQRLDRAITFE
jgi:polar amino acid transport system substrate-binding protein